MKDKLFLFKSVILNDRDCFPQITLVDSFETDELFDEIFSKFSAFLSALFIEMKMEIEVSSVKLSDGFKGKVIELFKIFFRKLKFGNNFKEYFL